MQAKLVEAQARQPPLMSPEGLDSCGQVGHSSMQTQVSSFPNG